MAILKEFWGPFFGLALMLLTFAVQSVQPVGAPGQLSEVDQEKLIWQQAAAVSSLSFDSEKAQAKNEPFRYPNPAKAVWYAATDLLNAFSLRKGEELVAEAQELKDAPPQGGHPLAELIWELKDALNGTGGDKFPLPKPATPQIAEKLGTWSYPTPMNNFRNWDYESGVNYLAS